MIVFEKSAGILVFRDEREQKLFLLLKYRNKHWDLPKGHIEENESLKQAAIRETLEETGINDLELEDRFRKNIYFFYQAKGNEREERIKSGRKINILKKVVFFLGKSKTKEIKLSHEQIDYIWLEYQDAMEKITYRGARKVLRSANQYLKSKENSTIIKKTY